MIYVTGFYGCFVVWFYFKFTVPSHHKAGIFALLTKCDCQLMKRKSNPVNYGSLKETSILTMSALTGDCLDWTCRMEAAQCLLLLIPVVWLLPDVLPNSAVPAKHGNKTFKISLIKQALVPLVLGLPSHLTTPAASTKHPPIKYSEL